MTSLLPCGPAALAQTHPVPPTQNSEQAQPPPIRYLDFTARNDGWAAAQTASIIGSRERKLVIVSYADPAMTRAFYDTAVSFTQAPNTLPIFGVVRAPQHPTEPNVNGFDIYINGVPLGEVPNPDNFYTPPQFLRALLEQIQKDDTR
ncbi:MAG: hypothetical protein KJ017_04065 [Alphaproteobacteria bacterium]|nr:hypothetical protein [Alphaproteobacteria bacterium]MCL4677754.1 hypothetical protein [Alphaproteobacteria bacterium]